MSARRLRWILPAFLSSTNDPDTAERECRDERKASEHDRVVSDFHIRRCPGIALHFAREDALRKLRQSRNDPAARIDDRGHAGIGRAQHGTPSLERAHARYLQVLGGSERVAEPGDVRDVHKQRRLGELADDLLAEGVLPADVRRDELTGERERLRIFRAQGKIRERNREGLHNPAETGWNELTEGNEVRLVVALRRRSPHADHAVEIASVRVPDGHADQNVSVTLGGDPLDVLQVARVDRVEETRNGGFGQDDELTLARFDEALVDRQSNRVSIRLKLEVLGNVSLEERNLEGGAVGRGPFDLLEQLAEAESDYERDAAGDTRLTGAGNHDDQKPGTECGHERHAVHPDNRSKSRERGVNLTVTEGKPGHTREDPTAQPLEERPRRGEHDQGGGKWSAPEPGEGPAGSGRIQRKDRAERQRAHRGKRGRHHSEVVQADVDPRDTDAEHAGTESETHPERSARRRRTPPEEKQARESEERQREHRERSVARDGQRACDQSRCGRGVRRLQESPQALPGSRC